MSEGLDFNSDKRFSQDGNQNYKIERVWDRQREIARRIAMGENNVQIAEALGCTTQTVSNVRNHPIVQEIIALYRGQRDKRVQAIVDDVVEFAPQIISQMKKIINNDVWAEGEDGEAIKKTGMPGELPDDPSVDNMIRASSKLLEIAIPQKSEAHVHHHKKHELDDNDISDIKSKSLELRRQAGMVEDVDYTEENEDED